MLKKQRHEANVTVWRRGLPCVPGEHSADPKGWRTFRLKVDTLLAGSLSRPNERGEQSYFETKCTNVRRENRVSECG